MRGGVVTSVEREGRSALNIYRQDGENAVAQNKLSGLEKHSKPGRRDAKEE